MSPAVERKEPVFFPGSSLGWGLAGNLLPLAPAVPATDGGVESKRERPLLHPTDPHFLETKLFADFRNPTRKIP